MHGVADLVLQLRWLAHLESKGLQLPTAFALLQAAAPEIAEWSHRHYFVVLVVQHCT
jgi:ligand-binding SRPBCC domain-containing protein